MTKRKGVPGSGLNRAAGIALVVIGALHLVVMAPHPHWESWFAGGLWNGAGSPASTSAFWAMPASFAVPMVLLGVMIIRLAPRGEVPAFLGWTLLAWDLICILLISPLSGFSLGLIPIILLVIASLRGRAVAKPSVDRADVAEPSLSNNAA
jgi:hypothetical protein